MAYGTGITPIGSLFTAAEDRRAAQEAQARNGGQVATVSVTYLTTGTGGIFSSAYLPFSSTFVSEPTFTTGATLLGRNGDPAVGLMATSGVIEWLRDSAGYYIGAKVWATVSGGDESSKVLHTLTFNGIAIKKTPSILGDLVGPIPGRVPSAAKVTAH